MTSSRGWLLMIHDDDDYYLNPFDDNPSPPFSRRPFLFNPLTGVVIWLPMLSIVRGDERFGALSSPPYDPDCTILLVSVGSVFLCRLNNIGDGWTTWTMRVGIDECIDSAVSHGGKFYFIWTKGVLCVIDCVHSTPTLLRLTMDVSDLDIRDGDRCRLVEFSGELLLVMEMYEHHCLEGFQVFKADLSGEKWVKKMDMLADHVLFLDGSCSLSLLASDVGCKKNCRYCTYGHAVHVWRVFDLDTRNWIHEETVMHYRFSLCSFGLINFGNDFFVYYECHLQGLDLSLVLVVSGCSLLV